MGQALISAAIVLAEPSSSSIAPQILRTAYRKEVRAPRGNLSVSFVAVVGSNGLASRPRMPSEDMYPCDTGIR